MQNGRSPASISYKSTDFVNGGSTTITFTITINSVLYDQDKIKITFPSNMALGSSVTCNGLISLVKSIDCSVIGTSVILPITISGRRLASRGVGSTISFEIQNVINPPSLAPTSSIQYFATTSDGYFIES